MRGGARLLATVALGLLALPAVAAPVRLTGELRSETRGTTRITLFGRSFISFISANPTGTTSASGLVRCRPLTGHCFRRLGRFQLTLTSGELRGALTFGAVQCSLTGQLFHQGCRAPCATRFQGDYVCVRELPVVDQGIFGLRPLPDRLLAE